LSKIIYRSGSSGSAGGRKLWSGGHLGGVRVAVGSLAEIRNTTDKRQKFIAAADLPLAHEILRTLNL
jgi:hypothetical protein